MKKYIPLVTLLVIFLSLVVVFGPRKTLDTPPRTDDVSAQTSDAPSGSPTLSTTEAITRAFGQKYNRPTENFVIDTSQDDGNFAKGSVQIKGEMGGALWLAAHTESGWELAHDGQGPMSCEVANKYNFPNSLVPNCIDTANDNSIVER